MNDLSFGKEVRCMQDYDEKESGMTGEVEFPKNSTAGMPGVDATTDVFSADQMNRNASAVGGESPFAAKNAVPTEETARAQAPDGDPVPPVRPVQENAAPQNGSIPQQTPVQPSQGRQAPPPQAPGGYPYAGAAGNRPGGDYYRNVYSNAGAPNGAGGQNNPYPYANRTGYAYPEEPPKKKGGAGKTVFIILVILLILGVFVAIGVGVSKGLFRQRTATQPDTETIDNLDELVTAATPDQPNTVSVAEGLSPSEIYKKTLTSSVGILVYSNNSRSLASEGSGVIFKEDNDGRYTYIITCAHVIKDKGVSVMVQLYNEKEYAAQIVGYDVRTDIGVLRIEASGLTACEIGDSDKLVVGEAVYAIGNPGGTEFANSFTNGMISAIDRPVSSSSTGYTMECIQHTAAINPGNSGGALLNAFGQVVGINSMKIIADEYEGMGFAVPSSVFVNIVNEIVSNGYVTNRPKLGITYIPASSEQAYAMFVGIKGLPAGSIIVYSISSDSSLVDTKLQKGDLIVGVNGKDLETTSDLAELVENSKVGDKLTLSIVRINSDYSYEEFEVDATLVEDRGLTEEDLKEETTTSYFEDYFGNGGDNYSDYFGDNFSDFFDRFFGNP